MEARNALSGSLIRCRWPTASTLAYCFLMLTSRGGVAALRGQVFPLTVDAFKGICASLNPDFASPHQGILNTLVYSSFCHSWHPGATSLAALVRSHPTLCSVLPWGIPKDIPRRPRLFSSREHAPFRFPAMPRGLPFRDVRTLVQGEKYRSRESGRSRGSSCRSRRGRQSC